MKTPIVTFVVPCYKLAHLLGECVQSILAQTYTDFEILIMDDCSPDSTPEVAQSFGDQRVKHIRNHSNLGHLRNYNKGIELARGKYIWLISADDYLRRPYILERYVQIMEANPRIGYSCCPGVGVRSGQECGTLAYSFCGNQDRVFNGHEFLLRLLEINVVIAASAMVRRECYEKISVFPLNGIWAGVPVDFGWNGDWYLWCMFALYFDVAYFSEPMVCYREHELSMTTSVYTRQENLKRRWAADICMRWLVRREALNSGFHGAARACLPALANEYARHIDTGLLGASACPIDFEQFEQSLCRAIETESERNLLRAELNVQMGNRARSRGDLRSARNQYVKAIRQYPWLLMPYVKLGLTSIGVPGNYLYRVARWMRRRAVVPFSHGAWARLVGFVELWWQS